MARTENAVGILFVSIILLLGHLSNMEYLVVASALALKNKGEEEIDTCVNLILTSLWSSGTFCVNRQLRVMTSQEYLEEIRELEYFY